MKKIIKSISLIFLMASQTAFGAASVKYQGSIVIPAQGPHSGGISGNIQILFDGNNLSSVVITPSTPVFGHSSFLSSEQAVYSETVGSSADLVVVFKLVGPPHPWRFVLVTSTTDQGKTYPKGVVYDVNETADAIKKDLDSGSIPSTWIKIGSVDLTAVGS